MSTVADVLEMRLRQFGVMRIYGEPLAGLAHIAVSDPDIAVLLADADGRIGHRDGSGRLGAALLDGPILHLSSEPGGTSAIQRVSDPAELFDALANPPGLEVPATMSLHLDLDLSAPLEPSAAERDVELVPVLTLDPAMAALRIVLLVGPGVVRAAVTEEVRELARRVGWGVVNTWGARGIERWDSPFNFATVGLQERDVEFSGLPEADIVVTSGLDADETPLDSLSAKLVQDVPTRQLAAFTHNWAPVRDLPTKPRHHEVTSAVVTPMYESDAVPLAAPRAALHLSGALPEGGLVVADPGHAGFWIARTFPTSAPESLCVPASYVPGFAAAAALVCALEGRPCIAVTDQATDAEPLDTATSAVLELSESLGQAVAMQLWGERGDLTDSGGHVDLTRRDLSSEQVTLTDVPVDIHDMGRIEAALGNVMAWSGQTPPTEQI